MNMKTDKMKKAIKTALFTATLAVAPLTMAGNNDQYTADEKLRDAWLDGKIETALLINRHLNSFTIDTDVKNGKAYLSGTVSSEIDRELAYEIAKGIEGVTEVDNDIIVKTDMPEKLSLTHKYESNKSRSFGEWYDDVTTTASIKTELLTNSETSGLAVNVDTKYGVVTINGVVDSAQEKELIEKIAENTPGVKKVESEIEVDSNS